MTRVEFPTLITLVTNKPTTRGRVGRTGERTQARIQAKAADEGIGKEAQARA